MAENDGFTPDDGFVADGFVADKSNKPPGGYGVLNDIGTGVKDAFAGIGSGVIGTGVGLYDMARKIPGAASVLPEPSKEVRGPTVAPPTIMGKLGKAAEQVGEFFIPAGAVARGTKALEVATAGAKYAPVLNALGRAVLEGASAAGVTAAQTGGDPEAMRNAALTAGGTSAAISGVSAAAPSAAKIYQSAIKPALGGQKGRKVGKIVETGIEEGIPASKEGLATVGDRIDSINQQIEAGIQARQSAGMKVDAQDVLKRLDDLKARAQYMDDPQGQLDAIKAIEDKFLKGHGTFDPQGNLVSSDIPIEKAQKMKQVIGTDIRKSYGEMKSYELEAKKQLVRGLKEEIESAFPEIKALNARESGLIDLEGALQSFVNREGNHQLVSPFTAILAASAAGAGGITHGAGGAAGAGIMAALMRMAMENPEIKSRVAIAARRGAQMGIPGMAAAAVPKAAAAFTVNRDTPTPQFAKGGLVMPNMHKRPQPPQIPNMETVGNKTKEKR